ncbi:hypothetical protein L207DRAFT_582453 [Hyaloscypha variabilis F]|uniref:Uncharacterized protein n=1 Tax=Hyaloscypha variabilis (strain UAMH 11265 / GT02V1 / F) TaxID=1149755 RepID=A0A2J6RNZ8_HYAVF|nr:hypothetical protein L207DRAFT_582453 [Hyaloscypha variabilis F]
MGLNIRDYLEDELDHVECARKIASSAELSPHFSKWNEYDQFSTRGDAPDNGFSEAHVVRSFRISTEKPNCPSLALNQIPLLQESVKFQSKTGGGTSHWLFEERLSVALGPERNCGSPAFTVVLLADSPRAYYKDHVEIPTNEATGIILFLEVLMSIIDESCTSWDHVLKELDTQVRISITDLFDKNFKNRLIFDDNSFSRSRLYFDV